MIRPVKTTDIEQLVEIYNHYIRETTITFEEAEVDVINFADRVQKISSKFPFLVYEDQRRILGYAYANTFRERIAYRFTTETSVYVRHNGSRAGVGSALYSRLIELLKEQGYHRAIGGITLPNDTSVSFHEKFGYKKVAHLTEVGKKFGQWLDVGFYELDLGNR